MRLKDLLLAISEELRPGVWVPLDCATYAASLCREVVRMRMPHMRMTEADVEAAVRELDLARFIRVREVEGTTCWRLTKKARRLLSRPTWE